MKYFAYGLLSSYIYSKIVLPKNEGKNPKIDLIIYPVIYHGMIIIPYKLKALHIHHWIIYFFILLLSFILPLPKFIVGFASGLFIQGLLYKDAFKIVCKNPY